MNCCKARNVIMKQKYKVFAIERIVKNPGNFSPVLQPGRTGQDTTCDHISNICWNHQNFPLSLLLLPGCSKEAALLAGRPDRLCCIHGITGLELETKARAECDCWVQLSCGSGDSEAAGTCDTRPGRPQRCPAPPQLVSTVCLPRSLSK